MPDVWRSAGRGPGRFWGIHGLCRATKVVEIPQDAYLTARSEDIYHPPLLDKGLRPDG